MANRIWLWSQAAVAVTVVIAVVIGHVLIANYDYSSDQFALSINVYFYGPGLVVSLAINQLVLALRRPARVTLAERLLLGSEYFLIASLIVVAPLGGVWSLLAALLSITLPALALAIFITMLVFTMLARERHRAVLKV